MRRDVSFKTEDGVTLHGWLYVPDGASGAVPAVVMAHGFSATAWSKQREGERRIFCEGGQVKPSKPKNGHRLYVRSVLGSDWQPQIRSTAINHRFEKRDCSVYSVRALRLL